MNRAPNHATSHLVGDDTIDRYKMDPFPQLSGWESVLYYCSADGRKEFSGDGFSAHLVQDRWVAFLFVDLTGHGEGAAAQRVGLRDIWRGITLCVDHPRNVLTRLNEGIMQFASGYFATAIAGLLDPETGSFQISTAGHPSAILRHRDSSCHILEKDGAEDKNQDARESNRYPPLGISSHDYLKTKPTQGYPELPYEAQEFEMARGEIVVVYSDGITEARNKDGEMFDIERLKACISKTASLDNLVGCTVTELQEWTGSVPQDDTTLLAIKRC